MPASRYCHCLNVAGLEDTVWLESAWSATPPVTRGGGARRPLPPCQRKIWHGREVSRLAQHGTREATRADLARVADFAVDLGDEEVMRQAWS